MKRTIKRFYTTFKIEFHLVTRNEVIDKKIGVAHY